MIGVGFIGLGGMGMHQVRSFAQTEGCRIVAGADPSAAMQARFAAQYPDAAVYPSTQSLLGDAAVDAVVIAVPTGYHQEVASAALSAGRPALVEKPMARTVAQCHGMIEDAARTNTLLMVAHCRRFDPYWTAWGRYVQEGKLGAPILWRDIRARPGPGSWFMDRELGGGPLLDGAVHNYDFANYLFGDPESVMAGALQMNPAFSAVDTGSALVRYRSGHQLLVSWSWAVRGTVLHDILGPLGFIQFGTGGLTPPPEDAGRYQYCCFTDRDGAEHLIQSPAQPDMYVRQAEHFLACIRGEAECRSPGTEAVKAVAVAEAIFSAASGDGLRPVTW